jgi:hypothetical protein
VWFPRHRSLRDSIRERTTQLAHAARDLAIDSASVPLLTAIRSRYSASAVQSEVWPSERINAREIGRSVDDSLWPVVPLCCPTCIVFVKVGPVENAFQGIHVGNHSIAVHRRLVHLEDRVPPKQSITTFQIKETSSDRPFPPTLSRS